MYMNALKKSIWALKSIYSNKWNPNVGFYDLFRKYL